MSMPVIRRDDYGFKKVALFQLHLSTPGTHEFSSCHALALAQYYLRFVELIGEISLERARELSWLYLKKYSEEKAESWAKEAWDYIYGVFHGEINIELFRLP